MKVLSVIRRVLERGCGVELRDVLHSSDYIECAAKRVALTARLNFDSDEAIASKIGHLEMGHLLYNSFERRAFQRLALGERLLLPHTHPRFTALLEMTGRAIVKAARERLPADLKALAVECRSASAKQQLKILAKVVREIRKLSVTHDTVLEDLLSQTEERVLPFCYGGGDGMPNCVGKAQLSAAFCELADIRAYAVTPILSSTRAYNLFHGRVSNAVCDVFRGRGIWLGEPLNDFVQRSFRGHELTLNALDWPHLGLVVQLRNGRWAAFDAAGDIATLFSKSWEIKESVAICDKYADALPVD